MGISVLDELPDISFIDDLTLEQVTEMMMEEYRKNLKEITGEEPVIERSDPYRLLINSQSVLNMQMLLYIDHCGKMDSLKYAHGDFLDHMGVFKNRPRKPAQKASVKVRFSMEAARASAEPVPAGILVTADQKMFFETVSYAEIAAGELSVEAECVCTVAGEAGNGYGVGEICTLVTPSGFISAVSNTTKSTGGSDVEKDDEYREGIFNAPNKYSTAGPDDAWVAIVKDFNADVEDARPTTVPGSGINTIIVLMKHGRLPEEWELERIRDHLMRPDIRTFGVDVQVQAPVAVEYGISLIYYIAESNKGRVPEIRSNVDRAVAGYTEWQGNKIGRDLNPDELLAMLKSAGVKRAVISSPVYTPLTESRVAVFNGSMDVEFGGVESD